MNVAQMIIKLVVCQSMLRNVHIFIIYIYIYIIILMIILYYNIIYLVVCQSNVARITADDVGGSGQGGDRCLQEPLVRGRSLPLPLPLFQRYLSSVLSLSRGKS